jgi:hypothetical protein
MVPTFEFKKRGLSELPTSVGELQNIRHNEHRLTYGPGRMMTYKPALWASLQNAAMSSLPAQTYCPGLGSGRFQKR